METKCKCGCGKDVTIEFLNTLSAIEHMMIIAGCKPLIINSGARCEKHNKKVGGSPNSSHMIGKAADISIIDGVTRMKLLKILVDLGWNRCGISKNFVHIDIDKNKPHSWWVY